jgi:uncharacterized protein
VLNIAVIGATGRAGTGIVAELLRRGHRVTGIVRNPETLPRHERLTPLFGDAGDAKSLVSLIAGHDAVVTAMRYLGIDQAALIAAVKEAGVTRLLVVGGAGSLITPSGQQFGDTGQLLPAVQAASNAARDFLTKLRAETVLDWTYLSPSAQLVPGERTGKFRLGDDHLLVAADGTSSISIEDFAIAMVDEIETPRHSRRRFTVGY